MDDNSRAAKMLQIIKQKMGLEAQVNVAQETSDNSNSGVSKEDNTTMGSEAQLNVAQESSSNSKSGGSNDDNIVIGSEVQVYNGLSNNNHEDQNISNNSNLGEDSTMKRKSRSRTRNPDNWAKNIKKMKKNTGQAYTTVTGKIIPAKKIKTPCKSKCSYKCTEKICSIERETLFNDFWQLGDLQRQRCYVHKCMETIKPKYSMHKEGSKRSFNQSYYFTVNSNRIRVCKLFFSNTLDIGHSFLSTINTKAESNDIIIKDLRGSHGNKGQRLPDIIKDCIREHINLYPRKESHYCRSNTSRTFLDGDLNLCMLYRQYKEWCTENNKPMAKQSMYELIFRTEFNISFHKQKKDLCSTCTSYQNATGEEKISLKTDYELHQREKELCRAEKSNDILISSVNENNKILVCFDLQAILQTPAGNDNRFFYKRRLNVYNSTFFNLIDKTGHCYLWHEGIGGKGCDEVGTCIYLFLKQHCIGKDVIFYSDNCSAQNKNKYLMALYFYAITVLGVRSITHKYLIVGHTQNEGDSVHATIEREKSRVLRNSSIYVPSQWTSIIQCAKKHGTSYVVHELDYTEFIDLKVLINGFGKNFTENGDGERVIWNNIKKIFMQNSNPYFIFYSDTYSDDTLKSINVRQKMRAKINNAVLSLPYKYEQPPGISVNKKKDLINLCESNSIPRVHWEYYQKLPTNKNINDVNDVADE